MARDEDKAPPRKAGPSVSRGPVPHPEKTFALKLSDGSSGNSPRQRRHSQNRERPVWRGRVPGALGDAGTVPSFTSTFLMLSFPLEGLPSVNGTKTPRGAYLSGHWLLNKCFQIKIKMLFQEGKKGWRGRGAQTYSQPPGYLCLRARKAPNRLSRHSVNMWETTKTMPPCSPPHQGDTLF